MIFDVIADRSELSCQKCIPCWLSWTALRFLHFNPRVPWEYRQIYPDWPQSSARQSWAREQVSSTLLLIAYDQATAAGS